ncbi:4-hydroxy-tetrahydrodipicolinate synthase [Methanobrevibacter sp. OttesenSCG-928-K11]|nr:4-hydroxy-tetrahydrodipicolinate synthase [Methanobrevibacter sp. OttesenSCG-928-K11]MDL2270479.1 4-hydroxy-tetrahydrodipicolinate synthase [Methanobrevibacter sp. OttesenSCG-928-I08]
MNFQGTYVAMVTPFTSNNEIDEEGFRSNINFLIENGVDGLLAVGTTGESATMSHDEHKSLIEILIDEVNGRVDTLAGAGSNSTIEAIDLVKFSEDAGADAALVITPYYNKPQQHGLVNHYQAIADQSDIPIIAYNVPSRTGLDILSETVVELAKIDNVDALKEATGDISKVSATINLLMDEGLFDDFTILSGDDGLTLPMMVLGANGVISASANVDPKRMVSMVNCALDGDFDKAREVHYEMEDLIKALFIETSPVPSKEALKMMGLPAGHVRQPLAPMKEENIAILKNALKESNII